MRLLLDTHIWVHLVLQPELLPRAVARALEKPSNELWLSAISVLELTVLLNRGRITATGNPDQWIQAALSQLALVEAPVTSEIARMSAHFLPKLSDPADRVLAATSLALDLTLVTADKRLLDVQGLRTMPAR